VQLEQLVLNLVRNAVEAVEGKPRGTKTIELRTAGQPDGSVQLRVSDTGQGIALDNMERVFEPFFTTKEHGLGLGLPISLKIARAHGGNIVAEPRPEGGSIFRLSLPALRSSGRIAP
jgi:signal transduction histidine kinase